MHLFRQRAATALLAMTAALAVGAAETQRTDRPCRRARSEHPNRPRRPRRPRSLRPPLNPPLRPRNPQPNPRRSSRARTSTARRRTISHARRCSGSCRSSRTRRTFPLEWLKEEVAVALLAPEREVHDAAPQGRPEEDPGEELHPLPAQPHQRRTHRARGDFIARNREVLARIERETGVDPYVVTAIIGIESIYGRNMGRFRVLDALMTLSFDYTRRAKYYRSELASFLDFCYRQGVSPVSVQGSFAGAMGLGSSCRRP